MLKAINITDKQVESIQATLTRDKYYQDRSSLYHDDIIAASEKFVRENDNYKGKGKGNRKGDLYFSYEEQFRKEQGERFRYNRERFQEKPGNWTGETPSETSIHIHHSDIDINKFYVIGKCNQSDSTLRNIGKIVNIKIPPLTKSDCCAELELRSAFYDNQLHLIQASQRIADLEEEVANLKHQFLEAHKLNLELLLQLKEAETDNNSKDNKEAKASKENSKNSTSKDNSKGSVFSNWKIWESITHLFNKK